MRHPLLQKTTLDVAKNDTLVLQKTTVESAENRQKRGFCDTRVRILQHGVAFCDSPKARKLNIS
jgi:hypothetical protein